MNEQILNSSFGTLNLSRFPEDEAENSLRAWNSSDEYLLRYLAGELSPEESQFPHPDENLLKTGRIAVLNDNFGAICLSLASIPGRSRPVEVLTDSGLSGQGTEFNRMRNGIDEKNLLPGDSLTLPSGPLDLLIISFPKNLSLLEFQLHLLWPFITPKTLIAGGGMVKHIDSGIFKLLESCTGPVETSLTWKKSRLIFCKPDKKKTLPPEPVNPEYTVPGLKEPLVNYPNLFSREKIDEGTRLLISKWNIKGPCDTICDFGCGNGIIGLSSAVLFPDAHINFIDESRLALACTEDNLQRQGKKDNYSLHWAASLDVLEEPQDLILSNPPFHQGHSVSLLAARWLIQDSWKHLKPGGILLMVCNNHLGYIPQMERIFGNAEIMEQKSRYQILKACRLPETGL